MSTVIEQFHDLYYNSQVWGRTTWMGVPCLKTPLDLWVYQEILWELKPELVIECGTYAGGSALYLAHLMDIMCHGAIVTVDLEVRPRPAHPRISYLEGRSSVDDQVLTSVSDLARRSRSTLVILDSDHRKEHVIKEMAAYAPFVTAGSYLIVEDTNINGHPVYPQYGEGPWEAVEEFLFQCDEFEVDRSREKLFLTFNPGGYLKRIRETISAGTAKTVSHASA